MSDYVAKQDIPAGDPGRGVFAYRRGDTVTAAAVEDNGWQEHVVGAGTKEARQIRAELTGEKLSDDTTDKSTGARATGEKKG